jgi:hypothetical protein
MRWLSWVLLVPLLTLISGCAGLRSDNSKYNKPTTVTTAIPAKGVLQNGYALLSDLLGDEKDVSLLRFIKREQPELKNLINDISRVSAAAHTQLAEFAATDPTINIKNEGLPLAELATRKSISTMKTRMLLHDKGAEFELQLLLSQNEALVYGANLAQVLASSETDSGRAQFFRQTADRLLHLDERVVQMLLKNYETPRTGVR